MYSSLWQTVLFVPLLVSAAPTLLSVEQAIEQAIETRNAPGAPTCGDLDKQYGWRTDSAPWRPSNNPGEQFFCATQFNKGGVTVAGVAVWKGKTGAGKCDGSGPITNVQLRLSNHEFIEIGAGGKDCEAGHFGLDGSKLIDKIEAWPSGDNPHAQGKTHIHIKDGDENVWLKDEYNRRQGDPWTQGTGSGLLVGLTGYVINGDVVQLNFHCLPGTVKDKIAGQVIFDENAMKTAPLSTETHIAGEHCNSEDTNVTVQATMQAGTYQTTTTTHQETNSYGFDISTSGEVGVPGVAKASWGWTFKYNHDTMDSTAVAKQNSNVAGWTVPLPVPAHHIGACTLTAGKGELNNIPYTQDVTLIFDDNTKMNVTKSGVMNGVVFSQFDSACDARPIDPNSAADTARCKVDISKL